MKQRKLNNLTRDELFSIALLLDFHDILNLHLSFIAFDMSKIQQSFE
jgi:hypothetical protein